MSKQLSGFLFCFTIYFFIPHFIVGQSGNCDAVTPFFQVDLTDNVAAVYHTPNISRDGLCCGITAGVTIPRCVEFEVTLAPESQGIVFDIESGLIAGISEYLIDCSNNTQLGKFYFRSHPDPFTITYCKPGGFANTFSITSVAEVSPTIAISTEQLSSCEGEKVLIEANIAHGGSTPEFTWFLNGEDLNLTTMSIELDNLEQNDMVTAQVKSSLTGISDSIANSNTLTFEIKSNLSPAIELTIPMQMNFCIDSTLIFAVELENEGTDPIISWWIDAEEIATGNEDHFHYIFNESGIKNIEARLISSEECVDAREVVSMTAIEVESCLTSYVNQMNTHALKLYPNPTSGFIQIDGDFSELKIAEVTILNISGLQLIENVQIEVGQDLIKLDLTNIDSGLYIVKIKGSGDAIYLPVLLNKL